LDTKKHKQALVQQKNSLKRQQAVVAAGPGQDVDQFSSPYPDFLPTQPPSHGLFHDARQICDAWLDEQGNEFRLPPMMTDDQNWSSQRAQDFWHDVDAGRSYEAPVDDLWGFSSDDNDSSSESEDRDAVGCEMPGFTTSKPKSNDFAPYVSKTVSACYT